ncbi:uncharacterized protein si:dkey-250k15.4 isoform X2 [Phycodurus eques]|uniref:uncharacterized protein si:dkey-250k15.4 isoform X2 n=1 Tax=Phycodurus eques TaxID=693459 RepID=UPI002ACE0733|nr:uncharacterized protein si:dkey-250k15.4 isoform X2 [Phycodurus eques]
MSHVAEGQSIGACKCHADTSKRKIKRLRSRKERSQTRGVGGSKDACKPVKAYQHPCHHQGSLDIGHLHSCCHHARRRNITPPPLSDTHVPTQEASVITTARLIGHRGLFNHEVKSIDIERLLLGKKGRKVKEKKAKEKKETKAKATSPFVSSDASGPDEEAQAAEAHDGRDKKSHTSEMTPDQREQDRSSFASSGEALAAKSRKVEPREKPSSFAERTLPRKKPTDPQRPPRPILRRTVAVEREVDARAQREGIASESIGAVAQRLCDALCFPLMKKRDPVAESREVLFRALRETHGQHLHQNLLRIHSGTGLHPHPRRAVHKPKATRKDRDRRWIPGKGRKHIFWNLSPPPQQHLDQTAAWPMSPTGISADFYEDIFGPRASPEFSMDFGCSSSSPSSAATHHLFAPSPAWRAEALAHRFGKTPAAVDSFEDCFARRTSQSQANCARHSPRQELTGRYSLQHFPLERDTLTENQQSSVTLTFPSHALTSLHSHRCPPSFVLESPPPAFTSLSSPKHWPFGSRKLY